ncbi:hypothetical protein CACET_c08360 [Clostridium aceticum]|uniref:Uncharacterized protein n=1 Tax=Clostridium aceticum TaxID=84022 RepID=A0A0G3W8Z7_9CLOT|nr:hypothetical protein CACET_c08360 [Clostridium aceticum]
MEIIICVTIMMADCVKIENYLDINSGSTTNFVKK